MNLTRVWIAPNGKIYEIEESCTNHWDFFSKNMNLFSPFDSSIKELNSESYTKIFKSGWVRVCGCRGDWSFDVYSILDVQKPALDFIETIYYLPDVKPELYVGEVKDGLYTRSETLRTGSTFKRAWADMVRRYHHFDPNKGE